MSLLLKLVNTTIIQAKIVEDYHQLVFEGPAKEKSNLVINNTFSLKKAGSVPAVFGELIGSTLEKTEESAEKIKFNFSNKLELEVDLGEQAFKGPEAMVLTTEDGGVQVWN